MASIVFSPLLIVVLLLLFGLLYLVFVNFKYTRRIARQWATWARTLGCHEIEFGGFAGPWLCCRIDGLWIKVTEEVTFFSEQSLVEVMAAAEILQAQGDVASVALLRTALAANPLSLSLRRRIEAAIESIQSRATAAEPGQLSLAAGETGQLSLTGDNKGQLSLEINPDIQKDRPV